MDFLSPNLIHLCKIRVFCGTFRKRCSRAPALSGAQSARPLRSRPKLSLRWCLGRIDLGIKKSKKWITSSHKKKVARELTSVISAASQTTFSSQSSSRRHFIESLTDKINFSSSVFPHSTHNHFGIPSVGLLIYCWKIRRRK